MINCWNGDEGPLYLEASTFRLLLESQGLSLGLWRAAEVAALREQVYRHPVLDLGCGDGAITSLVLPEISIGVDPYRAALEKARQLGIYRRLEAVTVEQASIPAGSISTVVCNSVLEHVERLDIVLATVARLLRPGGQLIFTVPTEALKRGLALPFASYNHWRNRRLEHRHLLPMGEWVRLLDNAGLRVEAFRPYLRRGLVRTWDALDLLEQVRLGRQKRLVGALWRHAPPGLLERLARWGSRLDLSAPSPGGGRLILASRS